MTYRGKRTCKILKDIRSEIARANDIEFITSECRYQGDCLGTCPKCEAEVSYLEQQLSLRHRAGKAVAIVGIASSLLGLTACNKSCNTTGIKNIAHPSTLEGEVPIELEGDVPIEKEVAPSENFSKTDTTGCEVKTAAPKSQRSKRKKSSAPQVVTSPPLPVPEKTESHDYPLVGMVTEPVPEFPGGGIALMKYVAEHVRYPDEVEGHIEGKVITKFEVKVDGSIGEVKVMRSLGPEFDAEVVRVVRSLPHFKSREHHHGAKNSWFTLPINFKVQEEEDNGQAPTPQVPAHATGQ